MILPAEHLHHEWGRDDLPRPFAAPDGVRVGEVRFAAPAGMQGLAASYLFTRPDMDGSAPAFVTGAMTCLVVLSAGPDAVLGLGSGDDLQWHGISAGDVACLPPHMPHAIGPDCTAILLHRAVTEAAEFAALHLSGSNQSLLDGPGFRLDHIAGVPDDALLYSYAEPLLVLPLAGEVLVEGEVASPGQCAAAPDLASISFAPQGRALVAAPVEG